MDIQEFYRKISKDLSILAHEISCLKKNKCASKTSDLTNNGATGAGRYIDTSTYKYVQNFTVGSWQILGSTATITVQQTVHQKGIYPVVFVQNIVGDVADNVIINTFTDITTGDVSIVTDTDSLFQGRIIIM